MNATRWTAAAIVVFGSAVALQAGELGEKAPPLTIKEWVQGKPVDVTKADGKNVYVVEFWATWCGPCMYSIPHLAELQKKYKDKNVTFIGVSIDDERTVDEVKPFVKKMGEKMNYTVAIDEGGATAKAYMGAFDQQGIPHAFVVNQKGEIIWHQNPHPSQPPLAEVLDQVLAGTFDLAAARKLMAKREEEARRKQAELNQLVDDVARYMLLVRSAGNEKETGLLGRSIMERARDYPMLLNRIAWEIMTAPGIVSRDMKLALEAAEAVNDATKGENAVILDTYALALFENGRQKEAVKVQEKAVKLAKRDYPDNKAIIAELEERLERFRNGGG
jgi:thiol-disulfide isomerase/thioredoxin